MKNIIKYASQEIAEQLGFLLISSIAKGGHKSPEFEIFIDSEEGINAEDCAKFSRELKNRLESTDLGELDYKLVVSSPGIDEPLKYFVQYKKHIGREFKLSYSEDNTVKSIEAKLIKIDGNNLIFLYLNEELIINFNNIKKAKVKISF